MFILLSIVVDDRVHYHAEGRNLRGAAQGYIRPCRINAHLTFQAVFPVHSNSLRIYHFVINTIVYCKRQNSKDLTNIIVKISVMPSEKRLFLLPALFPVYRPDYSQL